MRTGHWCGIAAGILAVWMGTGAAKPAGRFQAAYRGVEACDDDKEQACARAVVRAGREIDRFVTGLLRDGGSAEAINRALAKLDGYLPATEGKGVQGSCATFWSEPPRAMPSYVGASLPGGPAEQLLGIFNFSDRTRRGPGHLSLFTKTENGWRRTAGIDSSEALAATCLDHATGCSTLVVSEDFLGADRFELSVSTWKVGDGRLIREPRRWDSLLDADLEQTPSGVRVTYTKIPDYIPEPVLGARRVVELDLTAGPGGTEVRTTDLKPWLTAADLAYGAVYGKRVVAPALQGIGIERLRSNVSTVAHEIGDLDVGRGFVALRDDFDETALWCLDVTRRADGVWRIQNVKKTKTCGGRQRQKEDVHARTESP